MSKLHYVQLLISKKRKQTFVYFVRYVNKEENMCESGFVIEPIFKKKMLTTKNSKGKRESDKGKQKKKGREKE